MENRVGQPVTCAKLVNLDTMLVTPGKIIETSTSPMACRTQFAQSVPDARRLFLNWGENVIQGGVMTLLHRVVFYGDYTEADAGPGRPDGVQGHRGRRRGVGCHHFSWRMVHSHLSATTGSTFAARRAGK